MQAAQSASISVEDHPAAAFRISKANIPEHARKIMSIAAIELTESILRMPGGRELLDAEIAARKAAQAAK